MQEASNISSNREYINNTYLNNDNLNILSSNYELKTHKNRDSLALVMQNNEEMNKEYISKSYLKNNDFPYDEFSKMSNINRTVEIDYEIGDIHNNKSKYFLFIFSEN